MSMFVPFGEIDNPQPWMVFGGSGVNPNSYPGSGTTVYNVSGFSSITGSLLNGPTYNSNNGGYYTFDGINDQLNFGYASKPPGTTNDQISYSFGGWFMLPTTGTTALPFLVKGGPNTTTYGWSLQIGRPANALNNKFIANIVTATSANSFNGQAGFSSTTQLQSGTIQANTWYFVFGVFDYPTKTIRCYVNGGTGSATSVGTGTGAWLRGSIVDGWRLGTSEVDSPSQTFYNFSAGNVEIYNGIALSAQQVAELFNKNKSYYGY